MMDIQQTMAFHLMVLHLFFTKGCSKVCGDRCCLNYHKHRDGSCVECPLGTFGVNCSDTCVHGYYGRLCRSECKCSSDKCDKKHGCLMDNVDGDGSGWTGVGYIVIGTVTTLGVVGIMLYLKSWFSRRSLSSQETNQNSTNHPENLEEHNYETRRDSSSSESDDVVPRQATDSNTYTDLRFSRIEPEYRTTSNIEDDTKFQPLSHETISENSHHDEERNEGENSRGKYSRLYHAAYNVLSLRCYYPEKTLDIEGIDSPSVNVQYSDEVGGQYDFIEMNRNKEHPQTIERTLPEDDIVHQSLIDKTVKGYMVISQIMHDKDMNMKFDTDKEIVVIKVKSKSLPPGKVGPKEVLPIRSCSVTKGH